MTPVIGKYLREVEKYYASKNATEHTYRPALKELVESFGKDVRATNEPKRVACGALTQCRAYCRPPNSTSRALSSISGLFSSASTWTPRCTAGRLAISSNQPFR